MPMSYPSHPTPYPGPPPRQPVTHDPLAVALGNASLLGIGYALMRRWMTAIAALLITVALVANLLVEKETWCEVAIATWWVIVIAHGWFLARRQPRQSASVAKRQIALGLTIPVLLAVGLLRYDAARINDRLAEARDAGDCAQVKAAQDQVWFWHRVVDAQGTDRGDADVRTCDRLEDADDALRVGLTGSAAALTNGFRILSSVLADPGQERTAGAVLDEFLKAVPANNACSNVLIANWVRARKPTSNQLDRVGDVVRRAEPAALIGCGNIRSGESKWRDARRLYQQVIDRYPRDLQVAKARAGIQRADLKLELATVNGLVDNYSGEGDYCKTPAKYSAAPPYRKGLNRALFVGGADDDTAKLPAQWKTFEPESAVLMICTEPAATGAAVRTCPYFFTGKAGTVNVTFHKIAIRLKAYELRTGRLVANTTIQISGSACPSSFTFTSYGIGEVQTTKLVTSTSATVQAAYRPLLVRP